MHNNVRKLSELYDAHEKSIPEAVKTKANTMKQMTNRTKDLEESLTDNQDLAEEQITILKMN